MKVIGDVSSPPAGSSVVVVVVVVVEVRLLNNGVTRSHNVLEN